MKREIEIPEGYEARIDGGKVILEPKESEDERIRKKVIEYINVFVPYDDKEEIVAHLEKMKEQKPAEWSEEDDALLKEIVSFFKDGTVNLQHDLNLYAGFLEEKFKSLRPQPHWKPSEEQMDILDKVYHYLWADRNATADMQDGLGDFIDELKFHYNL